MSLDQLSQNVPEQKSPEFLALQKKLMILYAVSSVVLLFFIIIAFIGLMCNSIVPFIYIILLLIGLILLVFIDTKYRKYKFIKKVGALRILASLLLAINIFAIIPGLVAFGGLCGGSREMSRDATRKSHLSQLGAALALYYDENNNQYPSNTKENMPENIANFSDLLVPKFISTVPTCPDFKGERKCIYYYLSCNQKQGFVFYTDLEDKATKYFVDSKGNSGETKMPDCPSQ